MNSWQVVAVVVAIVTLYSAIVIWAVKSITRLAMTVYDRRLDALEGRQDRHERQDAEFREQLPDRFMLREDWNAFRDQVLMMTSIVDHKLDVLLSRIPRKLEDDE
jgi:hypothetical protein